MSKHTPGPWRYKRLATYTEPGHVVLWPDKGGQHMRRLDCNGSFTEADARLIAAAPELLDALKRFADYPGAVCEADFTIARAAIAKATGQMQEASHG